MLTEAGMEVVGQESRPQEIVVAASSRRPDAVVLDRDEEQSRLLCARVREAAPGTTVILWSRDETLVEVHHPGPGGPRLISPAGPEDLRSELAACRSEHLVED
jgi:DNA-binding NarL/FixJ family response regulator